jgi:hypothetical protein
MRIKLEAVHTAADCDVCRTDIVHVRMSGRAFEGSAYMSRNDVEESIEALQEAMRQIKVASGELCANCGEEAGTCTKCGECRYCGPSCIGKDDAK